MSSVSSFEAVDSPFDSSSECSTVVSIQRPIFPRSLMTKPPSPPITSMLDEDTEFFIEDDMAVFCVQDCLFKVHRFFLDRESSIFPKGTGSKAQPIELLGVTRLEFKSLLSFFYNGMHNTTTPSLAEWIALLSISTRFEMPKVRARAISEIASLDRDIDPVERIVLAQKYNVPEWLSDAYIALCEREQPLSAHEARKLEGDIPYLVAEAREAVLKAQLADLQAGCCCPAPPPVPTPPKDSIFSGISSMLSGVSPKTVIVRRVVDEVFRREEREKEAKKLAKEQELAAKETRRLQEEIHRKEQEKQRKLKEAKEAKEKAEQEILRVKLGDEAAANLVTNKDLFSRKGKGAVRRL